MQRFSVHLIWYYFETVPLREGAFFWCANFLAWIVWNFRYDYFPLPPPEKKLLSSGLSFGRILHGFMFSYGKISMTALLNNIGLAWSNDEACTNLTYRLRNVHVSSSHWIKLWAGDGWTFYSWFIECQAAKGELTTRTNKYKQKKFASDAPVTIINNCQRKILSHYSVFPIVSKAMIFKEIKNWR